MNHLFPFRLFGTTTTLPERSPCELRKKYYVENIVFSANGAHHLQTVLH